MTEFHRRHKLLDQDGQPIDTVDVDIRTLPLIERDALPGLPDSMEGRLMAPWVVVYHPKAELSVRVPLTDLANLERYVDMVNGALLKQAMAEPPDSPEGYSVPSDA